MDKYGHIPTYSTARAKMNGKWVTGEVRENKRGKFLMLDGGGSAMFTELDRPELFYRVKAVSADEHTGIMELSNGLQIPWGRYYQYKSRKEAEQFSELILDLLNGTNITFPDNGKMEIKMKGQLLPKK